MKLTFIYKKHDTLRYVTFFYTKKTRHFANKMTICVTVLYTENQTTLRCAIFIEFLKWRRGGDILYAKNNALFVTFLYPKVNALFVNFLHKKILTLCVIFLYARNNVLCVTILYPICLVYYWYLTINARTIRAIRSKNKFELFNDNWFYS